jgi:hypothetical protein
MILFNPSVIFEVSILPVALPNLNIFLKSRRLLAWPVSRPLLKAIDAQADMIKFNVRFVVCSCGKSVEDKSTPAQEKLLANGSIR